ncbi:MAG: hypothetical protein ABW156_11865 [Jiangellaceae bacterium]
MGRTPWISLAIAWTLFTVYAIEKVQTEGDWYWARIDIAVTLAVITTVEILYRISRRHRPAPAVTAFKGLPPVPVSTATKETN